MAKTENFTVTTSIRLKDETELPWAKGSISLTKENGEYQCACNRTETYIEQSFRGRCEQEMLQQISEQLSVHYAEIRSCCELDAANPKEIKNTAPLSECGEEKII